MNEKSAEELKQTAKQMVAPGKGILAADESLPTIEKRFKSINIENNEENRRVYREVIFTVPGIEEFISGVILFDETMHHKTSDDVGFVEFLKNKGIIPGIKVDEGTEAMPDSPNEKVTKGLEGLPARLPKYHEMGAGFAKWRAVITIAEGIPTDKCINENAERLAEYARLCQENGIVPMVEPEVLMDGSHTIKQCEDATVRTLKALFASLAQKRVFLPGLILKTNMVLSGKECPVQADLEEVARRTVNTLKNTVPAEVTGIAFLSGGQDDILATARLNEINKMGPHPWEVSFSYSRALLGPALKAWGGKTENVKVAQDAFYKRAKLNAVARQGQYSPEMEN